MIRAFPRHFRRHADNLLPHLIRDSAGMRNSQLNKLALIHSETFLINASNERINLKRTHQVAGCSGF